MNKHIFKVPFSGVGARFTDEEKSAVLNAMDSTTTYTQGPYQHGFEDAFCDFIGVGYSHATSCAATALELAAILLRLEPGDEVICPAHTYCASAYPFAKYGATIVWADIDSQTWVISPETIKQLITPRTRAIIAVHLYGLPAPMRELKSLAQDANVLLIEDCAQAIGANIGEKPVGSFGDMAIFSFQSHKNISTLGEGGMLCHSNDLWGELIPGLRHNGHRPFGEGDTRYWKPAMNNVDFDIDGVWPNNFCLGEIQCALGKQMLPRITTINSDRRNRFRIFKERFNSAGSIKLQEIPLGYNSTHHLLPIKVADPDINSDDVISKLAFECGVQAIVQYYPLNRYPLFIKAGFGRADVPNTDDLFDNMVSLPFHHWMPSDDFEYVMDSLDKVLHELRR